MLKTAVIILFALFLTACVPIPAEPVEPEEPRVPVGIRDLATVFAKAFESENGDQYTADQYSALLHEILSCSQPNTSKEEWEEMLQQGGADADHDISPAEIMALTMFNFGMFTASAQFMEVTNFGEEAPNTDLIMYELLERALEWCEGPK